MSTADQLETPTENLTERNLERSKDSATSMAMH
jgi:hypothetical protein